MKGITGLITPLLLHMVVSEITTMFLGQYLDSAWCASITALLVLPAALWMQKQQSGAAAKKGRGTWPAAAVLICFAGGGMLNLLWSSVMNLLHITEVFSNTAQENLLGSQIMIQIVGLGFLVPLTEEMIFRGLIYRRMRKYFPAFLAVIFSALLFAVYHGNPIQMIYAFPMAAVLAVLLEKGKHMMYPTAFHMGANLAAVLLNLLAG